MKTNLTLTTIVLIIFAAASCTNEGVQRKGQMAFAKNLAVVATPTASGRSGTGVMYLNDGITLNQTADPSQRPNMVTFRQGSLFVQYEWSQLINTKEVDLFWWADQNRTRMPKAYRFNAL